MFDRVEVFHRPSSVPAALRLMRSAGRGGRFVAGSTDVSVQADRNIRVLVDVTRLRLNYIRRKGKGFNLGATVTMSDLEHSPALRAFADGILAKAASTCGSVQNRNMATVGGNLANGSPAADTATPLLALDAVVIAASGRGRRTIPLTEFFVGPHKTNLNGALITEIQIPAPPSGRRTRWSFQKLGRTEPDISLVNVAGGLQLDRQGRCRWARIALGAVAPTPMRALRAESALIGKIVDDAALEHACDEVTREIKPISDIRTSAEYRREMSRVLARRALVECLREARSERLEVRS